MVLRAQSVLPESPLELAFCESCVVGWFGGLDEETRPAYRSHFRQWLLWLWAKPEWSGKMPSALLEFQENAVGRGRLILPRLMVQYVQGRGGTYKSMRCSVSHLRSLFIHNDVEVPQVHWQPHPTTEPVKGNLTFEQVRNIILHAGPRNTAIFLTMLQGLMDLERFKWFNLKYALPLVKHLKEKGLDEPFRIDFSARKRNPRSFYTFIYHDALKAWSDYFTNERGWPEREGEAAALTDNGTPPIKATIRAAFRTIAERLHYRPVTVKGVKSGVGPHEGFRDVVRSHLRLAKRDGFDLTCAEYWMGHSIDPLNYEKFTDLEPEYMLENVKIAAKYLNIISQTVTDEQSAKEREELRHKVAHLELAVKMLQDASGLQVATPTGGGENTK